VGYDLFSGDRIVFSRSDQKTRLVLSGYRTFYEVLSSKLKWGDKTRKS
jgi:NAD kinase